MLSVFSYTNLPENCWASLAGFDWLSWNDLCQGYPTQKGEADLEQAAVGESHLA
ncbi:hypothetical protein Q31a_19340 [Aureliella helgolandensis]|uniref:Uncharacterized protein n=1 Tax=Aureliella helgolandensis TaxID=2527968 RepID=A0A518G4V9_9BACT|nr:hypothetical protein Q31a_19340 [Aureliella helgolandensis]